MELTWHATHSGIFRLLPIVLSLVAQMFTPDALDLTWLVESILLFFWKRRRHS